MALVRLRRIGVILFDPAVLHHYTRGYTVWIIQELRRLTARPGLILGIKSRACSESAEKVIKCQLVSGRFAPIASM